MNNEHSAVTSQSVDEPLRQATHPQDATADLGDSTDLSIPDFLRRPVTPESIAAVTALIEQDRNKFGTRAPLPRRPLSDREATERRVENEAERRWRNWLPTEENHNVRPTIATFRKEVREEFAAKRERRLRVVSAAETEIPKLIRGVRMRPGAKEKALQASREAATEAAPTGEVQTTPTEAEPQAAQAEEGSVKVRTKTNKKASKANARKAVSNGKANGVRNGSKLETIAGLLKRKNGCTTAEVLKATGWPAVSMPQQAKAAGLKLRKVKEKGEPTRYFAA